SAAIVEIGIAGNSDHRGDTSSRDRGPDLAKADTLAHFHRQPGASLVIGLLRTSLIGHGLGRLFACIFLWLRFAARPLSRDGRDSFARTLGRGRRTLLRRTGC